MSKVLFEPIGDRLICVPIEPDGVSEGGILLPDFENQKCLVGRVEYAGPGWWSGPGHFVETRLKPGDKILYQRFSAQIVEQEGVEYHVIQERDVISKVNN